MRISDWSSDVCSSDLRDAEVDQHRLGELQRAFERLGNRVAGPRLIQRGGMIGVARAAENRQVGVFLAELARHAQLLNRGVHRQPDRLRSLDPELVEHGSASVRAKAW